MLIRLCRGGFPRGGRIQAVGGIVSGCFLLCVYRVYRSLQRGVNPFKASYMAGLEFVSTYQIPSRGLLQLGDLVGRGENDEDFGHHCD